MIEITNLYKKYDHQLCNLVVFSVSNMLIQLFVVLQLFENFC